MTTWDPDGAGPISPRVVLGGVFTIAGTVATTNIAAFDPATREWSALGGGVTGEVTSLAVLPSGELLVGGCITAAGGRSVSGIARWNGLYWSSLGGGVGGVGSPSVDAMAVTPQGTLMVGGNFATAGGVPANRAAAWDGVSWSALGNGLGPGGVEAVVVLDERNVVFGGLFQSAGVTAAPGVARWDGSSWSSMGTAVGTRVYSLIVLPNGELVAGGGSVMKWNGVAWSQLGPALGPTVPRVREMAVLPNGDLVVGGDMGAVGSLSVQHIARWDGTSWHSLGRGMSREVRALTVFPDGRIFAGGEFTFAGGLYVRGIASWDGAAWSPLSDGVPGAIDRMLRLTNGDLVVAGRIPSIGTTPTGGIARWDGSSWNGLGFGTNDVIYSLAELSNGDVVAGGRFTTAGGLSANRIARWNGASWAPLGTGLDDRVAQMVTLPNGDLVVAGPFGRAGGIDVPRIARWDGSAWHALGSTVVQATSMVVLPDGGLVVGGRFGSLAVWQVARWDGMAWTALGAFPFTSLDQLAVLPSGELVAMGPASTPDGLASPVMRWDGVGWVELAGAPGERDLLLPRANGDLLATNGASVYRWRDSAWTTLGLPMRGFGTPRVDAMIDLPNGEVLVSGGFFYADDRVAAFLAKWTEAGPPLFTQEPTSRIVSPTGAAAFSVATRQTTGVTFRWQLHTAPGAWIDLGPVPTPLPCGGSAAIVSPSVDASQATLQIVPCPGPDPGEVQYFPIRAVAVNACGSTMSLEAIYITCAADFDSSGTASVQDLFAFLAAYFEGHARADVNRTGAVSVQDVFDFVRYYFVGCP